MGDDSDDEKLSEELIDARFNAIYS